MKFALMATTYSPQKKTVVELYLTNQETAAWAHTVKLSDAMIWDDFDEIADYVEAQQIDDHKVVHIKEEDLFQARLKGK